MFSTVVLPQPEWPIMQTNSPRAIDSQRSSNTVVAAAAGSAGDALDGDELVGAMPSMRGEPSPVAIHRAHSGKVTRRVRRARIWSSIMPTTPIARIAMITLVIERLFHSFQTK